MSQTRSASSRLVPIDDLRRWLTAALERLSWAPDDAAQIAAVYLDSEMRGHESHGIFGLVRLLDARDQASTRPDVQVLRETEQTLLLDGGGRVVADLRAMRWCIDRARAQKSIAVAAIRNCQPIVPGFYVRMAAEAGLIGFACTNAIPTVAPPGTATPTLGTNPLAYGIPAGRYPPIVFDMATTTAAGYTVRLAAEQGRPLPIGTILDHDGNPTSDPVAFLEGGLMAPLGSPTAPHKGFGLALVIEVLAGVLTGSLFARDLGQDPAATGNLFWALDPEAFMPRAEFLARVDELIGQVKAAASQSAEEPLLPGERGQQRFEEITRLGSVPLSAAAWGVVEKAALTLEIPLPAAIQK